MATNSREPTTVVILSTAEHARRQWSEELRSRGCIPCVMSLFECHRVLNQIGRKPLAFLIDTLSVGEAARHLVELLYQMGAAVMVVTIIDQDDPDKLFRCQNGYQRVHIYRPALGQKDEADMQECLDHLASPTAVREHVLVEA